jgi:putative Mg2+ transporter-C (MgtC) family protein
MLEIEPLQGEIALRLALAAAAGAVVGVERELRDQAAGLRTHMLVSVGACLFGLISVYGFDAFSQGSPNTRADVTRVASNIVTGVGFLGAGAIIRHGLSVRGLTTAASLWVVAAIGTAVALGMYWTTSVAVVITVASLWGFRIVRRRIRTVAGLDLERIVLRARSSDVLDPVIDACRVSGFRVRRLETDDTEGGFEARLDLERVRPGTRIESLIEELATREGVLGVDRESG